MTTFSDDIITYDHFHPGPDCRYLGNDLWDCGVTDNAAPMYEELRESSVCHNCDDGCTASIYCDGCDCFICQGCWNEHNDEGECHVCGEYPERDSEGNLTEKGCAC